jgi:hypothetical protein
MADDTPVAQPAPPARGAWWRRWPVWAGLGVVLVVLVVGAVVAFGVFGVHTLVIDDVVDEAGPVFDSGAAVDDAPAGSDDTEMADDTEMMAATSTTSAEPVIETLAAGPFEGRGRYSAAGTAVVLGDGTDQRFLRFEDDFEVSNGPDLFVFLGNGSDDYLDPEQWVELGVLSGNVGAQNYEIPARHPVTGEAIDLDQFDHVSVWCRRFDSTFAIAPLS